MKCGKSAKKQTIMNKVYSMYMPSNVPDDDRLLHIKFMLESRGRFKHLFVEKQIEQSLENNIDNIDSPPQHILMIPEVLHYIDGKEIIVGNYCIDKSLLQGRLFQTCLILKLIPCFGMQRRLKLIIEKALALCLVQDSPYQNFNGTLPSGTNWEDYLILIRKYCIKKKTFSMQLEQHAKYQGK